MEKTKAKLLRVAHGMRYNVLCIGLSLLFSLPVFLQAENSISQEDSIAFRTYLHVDMPLRTDVALFQEFYRSIGKENRKHNISTFNDAHYPIFGDNRYYDPPTEGAKTRLQKQFEKMHQDEVAFERGKQELIERLTAYSKVAQEKPIFFADIETKFGGDIAKYVDYLYENSIMGNRKKFKRFMRSPSSKKIHSDPGFLFTQGLLLYDMVLQGR